MAYLASQGATYTKKEVDKIISQIKNDMKSNESAGITFKSSGSEVHDLLIFSGVNGYGTLYFSVYKDGTIKFGNLGNINYH